MITQLKNQDPFKPMESGEFLGQLAQFGTVSGLQGLQTSFDWLATSLVSNQALQAASLVGRSALVESNVAPLTEGGKVDARGRPARVDRRLARRGPRCVRRRRAAHRARRAVGRPRALHLGRADRHRRHSAARQLLPRRAVRIGQRVGSRRYARHARAIDSVLFGADGFTVELRGIGEMPFSAIREIRNEAVAAAPDSD